MVIRTIIAIYIIIFYLAIIESSFAQGTLTGKDVFSKIKGPYGSCNTCHPSGGSAGRWDSEFNEISEDGDRKIPGINGIGKKKTPEQIEKIIVLMKNKYKVPLKDNEIKLLVDYVSKL